MISVNIFGTIRWLLRNQDDFCFGENSANPLIKPNANNLAPLFQPRIRNTVCLLIHADTCLAYCIINKTNINCVKCFETSYLFGFGSKR